MKLKYYEVCVEGIDRTGKDTISSYITYLSNFKYLVKARGIASMIAYSNLYNRNYEYDFNDKNKVFVCLFCDYEDWKIRCKLTNEKEIDYFANTKEYFKVMNSLEKNNLVLYYNTSEITPYCIAKKVISILDTLNGER